MPNTVQVADREVVPSKIVCVGRNYAEHVAELGNEMPDAMVIFIKPNSAITDTLRADHGEPVQYEGELCFMVEGGRFAYVGFGLDLTKRGQQLRNKAKGLPWERAKAFDGAALFSRFVPIDDVDPSLGFDLAIDGETVQRGDQALMSYRPDAILAEIRTFLTLEDGDIVMTGTPKGVAEVEAGRHYAGRVLRGEEVLTTAAWVAA